MTKNETYTLHYTYTNNPNSKKHYFDVKVKKVGVSGSVTSKNFSIGRDRTLDEAYEEMVRFGKTFARTYNITENAPPPKEKMVSESKTPGKRGYSKSKTSPPASNVTEVHAAQFMERFGVEGRFKAMIKKAVTTYGVEKVKVALEAGLEEIKSAEEALAKEQSIRLKANRKMAEAIMEALDDGVHIESPNPEITALLDQMKAARERQIGRVSSLGKQKGNLYRLDGEEWRGNGHMPASFVKWIDEDDSRSIEDLRVA